MFICKASGGGASASDFADDLLICFAELEILVPFLRSRIKEFDGFSREIIKVCWFDGLDVGVAFETLGVEGQQIFDVAGFHRDEDLSLVLPFVESYKIKNRDEIRDNGPRGLG